MIFRGWEGGDCLGLDRGGVAWIRGGGGVGWRGAVGKVQEGIGEAETGGVEDEDWRMDQKVRKGG